MISNLLTTLPIVARLLVKKNDMCIPYHKLKMLKEKKRKERWETITEREFKIEDKERWEYNEEKEEKEKEEGKIEEEKRQEEFKKSFRQNFKQKGKKKDVPIEVRIELKEFLSSIWREMEEYVNKPYLISVKPTTEYLNKEKMISMKTLGEFLNDYASLLKRTCGISKRTLAKHWDIKPLTLNKYITNTKNFDIEFIYKISSTFSLAPELWLSIESTNERVKNHEQIHNIMYLQDFQSFEIVLECEEE